MADPIIIQTAHVQHVDTTPHRPATITTQVAPNDPVLSQIEDALSSGEVRILRLAAPKIAPEMLEAAGLSPLHDMEMDCLIVSYTYNPDTIELQLWVDIVGAPQIIFAGE